MTSSGTFYALIAFLFPEEGKVLPISPVVSVTEKDCARGAMEMTLAERVTALWRSRPEIRKVEFHSLRLSSEGVKSKCYNAWFRGEDRNLIPWSDFPRDL